MMKKWMPLWVTAALLALFASTPVWSQAIRATLVTLSQTGTDNNVDANVTNSTLAVTQSGAWDEVGINDSGNSITVDGTVTANLAAGTNNIGDVDVLSIAAGNNNIGDVDIASAPSLTIGTFPDNEPINLAQVGGTTVTGGNGASTAGSPRVVLAQDSGLCNPKDVSRVAVAISSSGNNELVALTSGQTIYVCDALLISDGTVAVQFIYGTGTACATGETDMSGPMGTVANLGFAHNFEGRLKTAEANALCIELSGAVAVNGVITYRKLATF